MDNFSIFCDWFLINFSSFSIYEMQRDTCNKSEPNFDDFHYFICFINFFLHICELGILSDEKQGNLDKGNIFLVKEKEHFFTFRRLIYFFQ